MMTEIGLVLSGGGARGFAHVGVYQAMEELGLSPSIISGTSMGAVMGALIANGYTSKEIIEISKSKSKTKMFDIVLPKLSLASHAPIRKILHELLPEKIEDLKIPFRISTTNLTKGINVMWEKGNLIDAVLASSCIPVAFDPIAIDGELYVDGGLTRNLPSHYIRKDCDYLIGSHVNYIEEKASIQSIKDIMERCFRISIYNSVREDKDLCDVFIDPVEVRKYDTLDFDNIQAIIDIGYQAAKRAFRTIP